MLHGREKAKRDVAAQSGHELMAQGLSDDLKRKISELYLQIRGGGLSPAELAVAEAALEKLKGKLETKMIKISTESPRLAHL